MKDDFIQFKSDTSFSAIRSEMSEIKAQIHEKKSKQTIEVHYFTKEFYHNKRDPLVKEIIQNGVRLI